MYEGIYGGKKMGLLGSLWGGGSGYICPLRKQKDRERIEIERSLDRQATKAIIIIVLSQMSEGMYDPKSISG